MSDLDQFRAAAQAVKAASATLDAAIKAVVAIEGARVNVQMTHQQVDANDPAKGIFVTGIRAESSLVY